MNRTIGQSKAMNASYGAEAQAASLSRPQVEIYLGKLDSRVGEVEEAFAELRRHLSPFLMPEQEAPSCEPPSAAPGVMSETTYHIHGLTERLEALRGAIGDVLSRL